jgi:Stigma-specific protein, Stig1
MPRPRAERLFALLLALAPGCLDAPADGCAPGWSRCAGVCTNPALDPSNCGACGNPCGGGSLCAAGRCVPLCGAGTAVCGARCVDPQTSDAHCGACGNACAAGQRCADGRCAVGDCGAGTTRCDARCVDLANDPAHCGACGNACGEGNVCAQGACTPGCPNGLARCNARCVDLANDPAHCGACSNACGEGNVCGAGLCALRCAGGTTRCERACVDLGRDARHCGACGSACASGESCVEGRCARSCPEGQRLCGARCVDAANDPNHCGSCENACAAGASCALGGCRAPASTECGPGNARCGERCVDVRHDPANCGACGNACDPAQRCAEGRCEAAASTCADTQLRCGDVCAAVATDPANCGACGNACRAGERCVAGACACALGTTSCRTVDGTRCVDTATNAAHCGACNRPCTAEQRCAGGLCRPQVFCEVRPGDAAGCGFFPPRIGACGGDPVTVRDRLTGRVENFRATLPLPAITAPGALVRVDALLRSLNNGFGGTLYHLSLDNAADVRLTTTSLIATTPVTTSIGYYSGIPSCQRPTNTRVETQVIAEGEYELERSVTTFANYNLGALTLEGAVALPLTNGALCVARCGQINGSCGDAARHYYRVDLPAGRALAVSLSGDRGAGGTVGLDVLRDDGLRRCEALSASAGETPTILQQRVVNAAGRSERVVLAVFAYAGAPRYALHVALEPQP